MTQPLEQPEQPKRDVVAISCPGDTFSSPWVHQWSFFLAAMLVEHRLLLTFTRSNNIYLCRNRAWSDICKDTENTEVDYVLFIDSDNLVTYDQFLILKKTLQERPDLAGIGAYYWVQSNNAAGAMIAAGWFEDDRHLTMKEIGDAVDPIEIDYIGMGFLLMRGSMLKSMPAKPFTPVIDPTIGFHPDDSSFLYRAKELGFKFAVHPDVHVPHLKLLGLAPLAHD